MNYAVNKVVNESSTTVKSNNIVVCEGTYEVTFESEMYFNLSKILKENRFRFTTISREITEDESFVFKVRFKINTKSKCHADDKFDEQFGRDLAEDRNSIKAIDKTKRIAVAIQNYLTKESLHIGVDIKNINTRLEKMDSKLKDRCGSYVLRSNNVAGQESKTE